MQKWLIVIIISFFLGGSIWISYKFYQLSENKFKLSENIAWQNCIKGNAQSDASNLVCRSLYPNSYKLFSNEFNK